MTTGSVLHGSGTAWYDAFTFATDRRRPPHRPRRRSASAFR
jgi:hypothetical protein